MTTGEEGPAPAGPNIIGTLACEGSVMPDGTLLLVPHPSDEFDDFRTWYADHPDTQVGNPSWETVTGPSGSAYEALHLMLVHANDVVDRITFVPSDPKLYQSMPRGPMEVAVVVDDVEDPRIVSPDWTTMAFEAPGRRTSG